ncbi:MAG: tetratricopeptide repeat protein [Fluviicola sp.]
MLHIRFKLFSNQQISLHSLFTICAFLLTTINFTYCQTSTSKNSSTKDIVFKDDRNYIKEKLKEAERLEQTNDDNSLKVALDAYERAKRIKDHFLIGEAENLIGNIYWYSGDYSIASEFYFRALKNFEKTNNRKNIAECYRNIGWIYLGQKNFDKAEEYFIRSSRSYKNLNLQYQYMVSLDDLGNLYLTKGDLKKALYCCELSIDIAEKSNENNSLGTTCGTSGSIYLKLNNYDKAEEFFLKSISLLTKYSTSSYNVCLSHIGLANVYIHKNNFSKAQFHADNAITLAKKGNFNSELAEAYFLSSKIHKELNKFDKAYEMSMLYSSTKDSLHELNNRDYFKELENKHKLEQDRLHIQNLEQKGKLDTANLEREQTFKAFLIVIIVLIFIFGIFLFRSIVIKKRSNKSLSEAYTIIEEKNKDISDSIDYAKHIQHARLPLIENLKNGFSEVFVYYVPRDIVSGDFYWYDKRSDGSIYFVCADCTGHGIPGAFMSMMGIDGFNYAILERNIHHTGEILTHVNRFIKDSLNQEHASTKSKDGMDAAIISLNPEKTALYYSGANRPMYIIRNNELIEFKPDKLSIGGNHLKEFHFDQQTFLIEKGDCVYLFSDGYADQFGGENGKKFMTKQLKELLLSIHKKPMTEQEKLIQSAFEKWKSSYAQVDDVLVVGIKI